MNFYSAEGIVVNTATYPDYEKTKYKNFEKQANTNKRVPSLYDSKEECCGCFACFSVCPRDAISMEEDLEGFPYPAVDLEKCVKCYLCEGVCPIKRKDKKENDL